MTANVDRRKNVGQMTDVHLERSVGMVSAGLQKMDAIPPMTVHLRKVASAENVVSPEIVGPTQTAVRMRYVKITSANRTRAVDVTVMRIAREINLASPSAVSVKIPASAAARVIAPMTRLASATSV